MRKLESILSEEAKGADILVNVAGSWEGEGPIVQTEPEKWWKDFVGVTAFLIAVALLTAAWM